MTDTFCTGEYSYYENLKRQSGADINGLFPPATDGTPWPGAETGETAYSTLFQNAIHGKWLPVFIPEGCDGHLGQTDPRTGDPLPDVVLFPLNEAAVMGPLNSAGQLGDPAGEQARYEEACKLGLESATYTSGSPYVKEAE